MLTGNPRWFGDSSHHWRAEPTRESIPGKIDMELELLEEDGRLGDKGRPFTDCRVGLGPITLGSTEQYRTASELHGRGYFMGRDTQMQSLEMRFYPRFWIFRRTITERLLFHIRKVT